MLVKGASSKDGPRVSKTYPDASKRQDRKANARGEIPVWLLNTLVLKDALAADMERTEPGPGYIHWPAWLGAWFFEELTAEVRTAKGWENAGGARNEAMDLMVYNQAAWLCLRAERLDWNNPPAWAQPARSAIPIKQGEPTAEVKPPPKPKPSPPAGGGFINRPVGVPWIR
jgi:phage terminase large subunit GpA-like protein